MMRSNDDGVGTLEREEYLLIKRTTYTYLLSVFAFGGSFAWYTNPGCATVPTDSLVF